MTLILAGVSTTAFAAELLAGTRVANKFIATSLAVATVVHWPSPSLVDAGWDGKEAPRV